MIDIAMPTSMVRIQLCEQLEELAPFGKGNDKPLFGELRLNIRSIRLFGSDNQYARITYVNERGEISEGVDFNAEKLLEEMKEFFGEDTVYKMLNNLPNDSKVDILYYPEINEYRDMRTVQIKPVDIRKSV